MKKPSKLSIANLPTPIQPLNQINPAPSFSTLYIKRDDFTGLEMSGNKIRKLEYHLHKAQAQNAGVLITCGGLQSNHARAVAALAARFQLKCHLVLKGPDAKPDGNLLFCRLFGAKITVLDPGEYQASCQNTMQKVGQMYEESGCIPYIMPAGASNGLGMFGYYDAYEEILQQEQALGIRFDAICVADGSGGTYAGLYAADQLLKGGKNILGFNVGGREGAREKIMAILEEGAKIGGLQAPIPCKQIHQNFDYIGDGYAIASPELAKFIENTAAGTGILFDPVYTGKALQGVVSEIARHNPLLRGNVLFIHTGGQFGIFPQKDLFV